MRSRSRPSKQDTDSSLVGKDAVLTASSKPVASKHGGSYPPQNLNSTPKDGGEAPEETAASRKGGKKRGRLDSVGRVADRDIIASGRMSRATRKRLTELEKALDDPDDAGETAIMGHVIASFKVKSKGLRCFAGIAINSDGTLLAVSNIMGNRISIFEPSSFKLLREFGTEGSGPGQFNDPSNVVFSPNGHLLVAEGANRRIQEVTVTGEHVRYLHEDLWISLDGMTVVDDQVVVCTRDDDARIVVLDYASGNIIRSFGRTGDAPGKLAGGCKGVCPTPDHKHLLVAEDLTNRVSVFTMSGEFVRNCCFLNPHQNDTKLRSERPAAVCVGPLGELIIPGHEFLYLFSADGSRLLRKIEMDLYASLDGVFHDGKLYLLNGNTGVVKVIV